MLLILNLPLVGIWVKLLDDPAAAALRRHPDLRHARRLRPAQLVVRPRRCSTVFGVIGFLMRRYDIPVAPVLVGMILGPLRRAAVPPRARRSARATCRSSSRSRSPARCWSCRCCWWLCRWLGAGGRRSGGAGPAADGAAARVRGARDARRAAAAARNAGPWLGPRRRRGGGYACRLAAHADSLDAGSAVRAGAAACRRRARRRAAGRALRRAVDHRHVARPVLHAGGGPRRSPASWCAARRRRGVRDRAGLRRRASCWRGSPASTAPPASSRASPAAPPRWRCWASGTAPRPDRSRRGAEPAHPDRRRDRAGGDHRRSDVHGSRRVRAGRRRRSTPRGFALLLAATLRGRRAVQWRRAQRLRARRAGGGDPAHRGRGRPVVDAAPRLERGAVPARVRAGLALPARFPARVRRASSPRWSSRRCCRSCSRRCSASRSRGSAAARADAGARDRAGRHRRDVHHGRRCCSSACRW